MNRRTRFFLVLLQLCIGWHLFYEGVWKIRRGEQWTSKGYIRAATGPMALPIRWLAGDPEVVRESHGFEARDTSPDFIERFTLKNGTGLPGRLEKEWSDYFERFVDHYGLTQPDRQEQLARARSQFAQAKMELEKWLATGMVQTKPPNFSGRDVPVTVSKRLQDYQNRLERIADIEATSPAAFGANAATAQVSTLRTEANAIRSQLQSELDAQTRQMKQALFWEVLTPEQRRMERPSLAVATAGDWRGVDTLDAALSPIFAKLGGSWPTRTRVQWIDECVRWGLTLAGLGLLLGLLTRTSCTIGFLLLAMFYFAMPPLPGAPESPAGHYLFVNFNVIEAVALFLIGVSDPASRYGLDAWSPFRWRRQRRIAAQKGTKWPLT